MAAAGCSMEDLREEITCSICLADFHDPVMVPECGHNFCRACLTRCWGESDTEIPCPQCRAKIQRGSLIPNRTLANLVRITQKLCPPGEEKAEGTGGVCGEHREPLKLFCKEDGAPICVVCDRSRGHRDHEVIPLEEAAQEYKDQIKDHLETLMEEKEEILLLKTETENNCWEVLRETKARRQKAAAEFMGLRQFLEEQEKVLQAKMEELEKEIGSKRDEFLARLSSGLSSLESFIREMEETQQQPAWKLMQDIGSVLQRYQAKGPFENPVKFSAELKWKIWDFCDINPFLEGTMNQFKNSLESGLRLQKANVTLDPDTAHPKLLLSEDHKSVQAGDDAQDLPQNPERFDSWGYVLGQEGFTAGRHFWEISVGSPEGWTVGIAKRSVKRKGMVACLPEEGIWELGKWKGQYRVSIFPGNSALSLSKEPKRIRVTLNYEGGEVAIYDADSAAPLYIFSGASFAGETLQPLFYMVGKGRLDLK